MLAFGMSPAAAAEPGSGVTAPAIETAHGRIAAAKADIAAAMDAAHGQIDAATDSAGSMTSPAVRAGLAEKKQPPEHGTLYLLKPAPAAPATFTGRGGYSADGTSGTAGLLSAAVPPGSTVEQAYLYAYIQNANPTASESTVIFDGLPVSTTKLDDYAITLSSSRADVTPQVAAKVGTGSGTTDFSAPTSLPVDGLALVVIYSNPALPARTIAVFDGAAQTLGDTATFSFNAPLDKSDPGFSARMSLGIGFSFQQGSGHMCGPGSPVSKQHSVVDVNGVRLTSCAGGDDDAGTFGSLITVGGVGDSTDNPVDPFQTPADGNPVRVTDDEFYDLEPFLSQGDTSLTVTTSQPSNDDILFLSIIQVDALASVTTEVCGDGLDGDADGLPDGNDPDCPGFVVIPIVVPVGTEICGDGTDTDKDGRDPPCPLQVAPVADPPAPGATQVPPRPIVTAVTGVEKPATQPSRPGPRTLPRTGGNPGLLLLAALSLLFGGLVLTSSTNGRRGRLGRGRMTSQNE
ncbi:MAG TPA: hypothetical protein VFV09_12595 [Actinomycetota bacterium]|nr:hypothetical protein [Actinomycetota bacterium]